MPPWRSDIHSLLSRRELTLDELCEATGQSQATIRDFLTLHDDVYGRWTTQHHGFPIRRYFVRADAGT